MAEHRTSKLVLAGVAATAAVGAIGAWRTDRKWAAADDPCAPGDRLLPIGRSLTVTTDDGAELAVTDAGAGDGPVVVLAHGWTNAREVWAPVAHRLLRSGHRVVLYDQRGHGSSTVGRDGFTIEALGDDLKAVLEAVDAEDAVLAGHSMGGMTIQSLVGSHRDVVDRRVAAIVLVATAASGVGTGAGPGGGVVASAGLERLMRSRVGHFLLRGSVGDTVRRNHLVLARDLFVATPPEARLGWFEAMRTMDLRKGLAGLDVPTTILVGSKDRLTPPGRARELAELLPGARLVTMEGLGHFLPLEAPDDVAEVIASARMADRRVA